jgi:hypothetical protein
MDSASHPSGSATAWSSQSKARSSWPNPVQDDGEHRRRDSRREWLSSSTSNRWASLLLPGTAGGREIRHVQRVAAPERQCLLERADGFCHPTLLDLNAPWSKVSAGKRRLRPKHLLEHHLVSRGIAGLFGQGRVEARRAVRPLPNGRSAASAAARSYWRSQDDKVRCSRWAVCSTL